MIFINLPVTNLERSKRFYEAVGFTNNPMFTNDQAAAMAWSDTIVAMLLTHDKFRQFTPKRIADARESSEVLICISADSRQAVDETVEKADGSGGRADPGPKQEMGGMMYGRSFEDPDGHIWEVMWMDVEAAKTAMAGCETETAAA